MLAQIREIIMSDIPFSATTPIHVSKVGLISADAEALGRFYGEALGLEELDRRGAAIVLGAGGRPLLEIEERDGLKRDDPSEAGLFHTAFLLPERRDLARWLKHAAERRIGLSGASDHLVSEAVYLSDPDGNGIEIYVDRPADAWPHHDGEIAMATNRLDTQDLLRELDGGAEPWKQAPDGTVIGHVHLRVGDPAVAEDWWTREIGLDAMAHYGSDAVFLASGGYHHHIGANAWHSRGAGARDDDRAGLAFVELAGPAATGGVKHDPWGTQIRLGS